MSLFGRLSFSVGVAVLAASAAALLGQACLGPAVPPRPVCGHCEGEDRFVRLQAREPGSDGRRAASTHSLDLPIEDWAKILASIQVRSLTEGLPFLATKGPVEPAFTGEEIAFLSPSLSKAFAAAGPGDWVVFEVTRQRGPELVEVTSGGWFADGDRLHLVLANYRSAVSDRSVRELLAREPLHPNSGPFYELVPGSHQQAIQREGPAQELLLPTMPELVIAYRPLLLGAPDPRTAKPAAADQGRPNEPPSQSIEERLQALKRLRDRDVITEEEFTSKKRALLERF